MSKIKKLYARQILDSRGNPTIEVDTYLENGVIGRAAVPSGASTGIYEAVELRDNDTAYMGKSVLSAVNNVNQKIAPITIGENANDFRNIDHAMIELDNTENKSKLGANAILGASMSIVKAASISNNMHLYEYLHQDDEYIMPVPMMNIINGGSHADNNVDIQEFMICPTGAKSFSESLQMGVEIFHNLKKILNSKNLNTAVGDEGGFAPNLKSNEEAIEIILLAIEQSGYEIKTQINIALDVAASELYNKATKKYELQSENLELTSDEIIEYYKKLCSKYPIISIEDGLDENDWSGWTKLTKEIESGVQLVGDDLTVTNPIRLNRAINESAMNAILIKLNQIGTVSETLEAIKIAQNANFGTIISHRSGETEDTFISDFSVAVSSGQIKTGSLCRTDRIAKYNQLLRIEEHANASRVKFGNGCWRHLLK
tara:strand:+ start:6 stop:1295 length:1290 start_codon:yes stop_codon:yes gene_type:complete